MRNTILVLSMWTLFIAGLVAYYKESDKLAATLFMLALATCDQRKYYEGQ